MLYHVSGVPIRCTKPNMVLSKASKKCRTRLVLNADADARVLVTRLGVRDVLYEVAPGKGADTQF